MQYTNNNGLIIKEKTDNYSRENFNKCMNIIDDGLCKFYVATLDSANTYKVTTGLNKTSLNDGYSLKVAIPSDSTGAVSIIVDSVTVPLKQANGNNVTNLKANGVYNLTYYNSVFILASGGGADTVNFSASDLLTGKTANNSNGEKVDGTMTNNGAKTATLNAGGSYTIPAGYHNGSGKITVNSLATQMANGGVTLTSASQLISGIKAYSKTGQLLTGTATIQSLGGVEIRSGTTSLIKRDNSNAFVIDLTSNLNGFSPTFIFGYAVTNKKYFFYDVRSGMGHYPYGTGSNNYVVSYIVSSIENGASTVIPSHIQVAQSSGFSAGDTVYWYAIKL
ncbi:hypothetical protein [uncultured Clostridium sp.]|uniref:hypothetical protein n=1 Tax=uncultured Clostridium sp. TaxID=59620 RepID=UPI0025EF260A|nr:hypothetical protein [uncultured Clostridium sp.]